MCFVTPRVTDVAWSSQITCFSTFFFQLFFCQRGLASFVTPGVTDCAWSSKVTCFSNFFFHNFLSKGSCEFCYSKSNRLCMVIQNHMPFKLFFHFFVVKGGLATQKEHILHGLLTCDCASPVTPQVIELTWCPALCCNILFPFQSCHMVYPSNSG